MIIKCSQCKEEFNKKPSQIKRSKNHFCKRECSDIWKKGRKIPSRCNKVKHNCHQCKEEILVENHKYKRFLRGEIKNLFCDKVCLADWQRINFKGEKSVRYSRVEKECGHCGERYTVSKSDSLESVYCSRECTNAGISIRADVVVTCCYCQETFSKKKHKVREMNFCKKECSTQWSSENNNLQVSKECVTCKKPYVVSKSRENTAKNCSKKCHTVWLSEYYFKTEKGKEHLRANGIKSHLNRKYSDTRPERILREALESKNIEFISQYPMYDKFIVDFYLPKENIVIEVNGDYWHGNPLFYGNGEDLKPLTDKQIKQKKKDKSRKAYLEKCGHEFHVLWENDIYKNLNEITKFL